MIEIRTGAASVGQVTTLVRRLAGELGAIVSVDTYKPAVARAAIAAGAGIVNDVSGLRDPQLAERLRADRRRAVSSCTRAPRRAERLQDPDSTTTSPPT